MIPVIWMALAAINLLLIDSIDPVLLALSAIAAVFWSGVVAAAAFYMRSRGVRSYFNSIEPGAGT